MSHEHAQAAGSRLARLHTYFPTWELRSTYTAEARQRADGGRELSMVEVRPTAEGPLRCEIVVPEDQLGDFVTRLERALRDGGSDTPGGNSRPSSAGSSTFSVAARRRADGVGELSIVELRPSPEGLQRHEIVVAEDQLGDFYTRLDRPLRSGGFNIPGGHSYPRSAVRWVHGNAFRPWTSTDDALLRIHRRMREPIPLMATKFGRTTGAIISRLKRLKIAAPPQPRGSSFKFMREIIKW